MSGVARDNVERRVVGVLRPIIIALLLLVCLFPFYYIALLSFRPLDAVLQNPGALWPQAGEIDLGTYRDVLHFPARAIGQSFTLQFVVKTSLGTKKINYPITVVK